ncbi:hypothetical protein ASE00_07410 [Sphingomonas sp. Root710]|nr:hypothetical protein ASE00_07410 [Sphingomonas sp. Root710]
MKSPSLRHIKDPYVVIKLAQDIVKKLDRGNSAWTKWNGPREQLVKSAIACWVPAADLRDHLNRMEGPALSTSDVEQRLRAFAEERYSDFARDEFRPGCLAIYEAEKADGTEMPAIIGVLQEHVEREEERLRVEQEARYQELKRREQAAAENRLLSGADCKWTPWPKTKDVYCRVSGRLFRLSPGPDKRLDLYEVESVEAAGGELMGRYLKRGDATKAVELIAYQHTARR